MLFVAGSAATFILLTPQPSTRTMLDLRDAGIAEGQPLVVTCPERLTPRTRKRIVAAQPGALRPRQQYARVARVARCFGSVYLDGGVGNCIRPSDGTSLAPYEREVLLLDGGREMQVKQADIIVPSLRANVPDDAADDGGEESVDDSLQYDATACELSRCSTFDAGDGTAFCGRLNRLRLVTAPCAIPLCLGTDGGWDDNAVVDCRATGPYGEMDGGPRWRGCNATPTAYTVGSACVPVSCGVVAGDDLVQEWR